MCPGGCFVAVSGVAGSTPTSLVSSVSYNQLGAITQIGLGNNLFTNYGYWGFSGAYDNPNGYYGRLYKIRTGPASGDPIQEVNYYWDAGGNLTQRATVYPSAETENFTYDHLDRLIGVSGAYSNTYTYDTSGNITSMNGATYSDSNHKHAVTGVGSTSYVYDSNGNMTTRGSQTITWDVENKPATVTGGASFVYDGDGNRVKKTEGGQTILYVNKYYEKNLGTGEETFNYYLGSRLISERKGISPNYTLRYVHQDSLSSISVMSTDVGAPDSSMTFYPFGGTRSGSVNTDKQFTGQRLDGSGLYYYGARYYDANIGRFISSDTVVPDFTNPQSLNRYSYALNNPLRYTDPTGHGEEEEQDLAGLGIYGGSVVGIYSYGGGYWINYGDGTYGWTGSLGGLAELGIARYFLVTPHLAVLGGYGNVGVLPRNPLEWLGHQSWELPSGLLAVVRITPVGMFIGGSVGILTGFAIANSSGTCAVQSHLTTPMAPSMALNVHLADDGGTVQTGGNTIGGRTAEELNDYNGKDLTAREWGRKLEALKKDQGIPRDDHGKIKTNGDYYDRKGNLRGNLNDY